MIRIPTDRLKDFIRLLRPHFLLGSVVLFLIGSSFARGGRIDVNVGLIMAILTVAMVQLAGQLADDYFDREGDHPSHRSLFAGGSGVIQSGSFSARSVLWITISICTFSLLLATAVAVFTGRWLFLPLIALGLVGGLAYSAPPARLASTWFGEMYVAFLIGFMLPLMGSYYDNGELDAGIVVVSLPLFLFTLESLIAVEFPDMEADRASGKRNLTFRLGIQRSKFVQVFLLLTCYVVVVAEVFLGTLKSGALLLLVTAPFSLYTSWELIKMKDYDFKVSRTASNVAMTVNGITMAILLIIWIFQ
ncbi:MAG: prenyltransferase [Methanomassiliicoccales archaeon]|jgi:1,4-dihydroxy-2-naphthoate octaprenyltransferase